MANKFEATILCIQTIRGRNRISFLGVFLMMGLVGCGSPLNQVETAAAQCRQSENLITDPSFTNDTAYGRGWRMAQHTGEKSFDISINDGLLQIERVAWEPWMLFRRTVASGELAGATVRYSAELRGGLIEEPRLEGFNQIGGLYLKAGRDAARLADHSPNSGSWEWQTVAIEEKLPESVTSIRVGFVHQAGGTLWARNPSLVIVECD